MPTIATVSPRRMFARLKMLTAHPSGSAGNGSTLSGSRTTSALDPRSYSANACDDSIATRSPIFRSVTPSPTASICPQASCPGAPASTEYLNHGFPNHSSRFEAQTPQPSMRTRTSPAAGARNSTRCISIRRGAEITAAYPGTAREEGAAFTVLTDCTRVCSALALDCCDRGHGRQVCAPHWTSGVLIVASAQPLVQTPHALMDRHARFPTGQPAALARIRNVVTLIRRSPVFETDGNIATINLCKQIEQFQQADTVGGPPTNVESISRKSFHVLLRQQKSIDQIVDKQNVARLQAVAIDSDWLVRD